MSASKDSVPNPAQKGVALQKGKVEDKRSMVDRVFRRSHGVTKDQLAELTARFPNWDFEFGKTGAIHPHAVGATERAITEQLLYEQICKKYGREIRVTDIGGNANRHVMSGRSNVHSCNPILSAADAIRRHPENYLPGADYCNRPVRNCTIIPDVYLSVHSLYYLSREEVLELVLGCRKKRLFAVVHSFNHLYGSFHEVDGVPESTYEAFWEDDQLKVHMKVTGNHTGYTHPTCSWMHESNYFSNGLFAMAWTSTPIGDSYMYEFVDAPTGLQPENSRHLSLCESLNRKDHYGHVDGVVCYGDQAELTPMLDTLKVTTGKVVSAGSYTVTLFKSTKYVLVPKDIIVYVGNLMVGLPRNEKTLATCINRMRSCLVKYRVPESMKSHCLTYGSAYAFIYSIRDEIDAFNNLCKSPMRKLFDRLSNALSLTPLGCCQPAAEVEINHARRETASTMATLYSRDYVTPAAPAFDTREAWPKGLPGYESNMPLASMKEGARLKDTSAPDVKEYQPQLQVNCPVFTPIQAVVPNPSKNNELRALVNRALVETYVEEDDLWKNVHRHAATLVKDFDEIVDDFDELFRLWNAKFPPEVRRRYLAAFVEIKRRGILPKDLIMKMFIKREVTLKYNFESGEMEDFDPRAIQGCTDEMNVAYGPFIWACSKRLCKEWNLDNRICYTSGLTAEEIGSWRSTFDSFSELTIIELDESRYDAHQGRGMSDCSRVLKNACGIQNYALPSEVEDRCYEKSGRSKFFSYRVPGTMTSGKADTSVSNSFGNGVKLDYLLRGFGFKESEYRMLVNGDDSLVVVTKSLTASRTRLLQDYLVSHNKRLGFKTKCKVRTEWHEVEYCSGLFWPVADGYVLGPKIGRRLPKLGFGLRQLSPGEVESMVHGMANDLAHIPVLSLYYSKCMSLLKNLEKGKKNSKKEYVDKEAAYKWKCKQKHKRTNDTDIFFQARYGYTTSLCEESFQECLSEVCTLTDAVHYPMMEAFSIDL